MARREPEYRFVLAEVDYLPYWDTYPEDRGPAADDRRSRRNHGRVQRANTNLTAPRPIRNFVHGMGFQRDVLGPAYHCMAAGRLRATRSSGYTPMPG
jgi:hypothetical protein